MYEDETIGAKTDITITGKAEGKTSVKIGDKTYFIFVENDVEKVTLKVGDTIYREKLSIKPKQNKEVS